MKKVSLTIFFIMFFMNSGLFAAQEGPYRLDDIVVTASRIQTPLIETSTNVTIITQEDIKDAGARTLIDVFDREPGIITSSLLNNPKRAQVDIRGYGEAAPQNVLFLVDGRRINSIDLAGTDLSQIPIDIIERVEIYRGPASVLFGDNAAAGVVNIILKKGEGKPKVTAGASVGSDKFLNSQLSVSGQEGNFSYFALAAALDTDGYRHNNDSRARDLFGNFSFDVLQNLNIAVKAGHHKDKYGLPGALYLSDLRRGSVERKDSVYPFDHAQTEDNFVDTEVLAKIGNVGQFTMGGSYRNRQQPSYFYYGSGSYTESRSNLATYSLTPKFVIDTPIFGRKSNFVVGWDYYNYPTTVKTGGNSTLGPSSTDSDINRTDNAFYINERLYPSSNLLIEAGYRRQKARYDIDYTDQVNPALSSSAVTHQDKEAYRFSANYFFGNKGDVFISYGRGFRFPMTDEFVIPGYCYFGYCQPTQVNGTLRPQITDEIDVGFRYNPVSYAGGSVTFFQSKNKNEIYYDPILYANMNYDKTKRTGGEASLFFRPFDPFLITINYSYIKAIFDGGMYDGNDVPLVPNNKLGVKLSYTMFGNLTFNLMSVARSNYYVVSDQKNQQPKLPGYTTYDASIVWRTEKVMALFAIKNLTGKKYSEYGVYSSFANEIGLYPSPERQFFLSIQYTFGG
jgi:iron complex outermembrane recepter protein